MEVRYNAPNKKGSTDQSCVIRIIDSTTGLPEEGVEHGDITLWFRREGETKTPITPAALSALDDAYSSGGIEHIDDGYYRLDLPNPAVAAGSGENGVMVGGTVTDMVVIGTYLPLVDFDPYDAADLGLTNLTGHTPQTADNNTILANGTYGNSAIKTLVDAVPTVTEFNARSMPTADYTIVSDLGTVQSGDSYAIVNGAHGLVSIQDDVDTILVDTADMQPRIVAIEIDTNELQSDDVPGLISALDTVVDRIETDTQDLQTQVGTAGDGLSAVPVVTLANGAHGGGAASVTLASYTDFTGAGASNPNLLLDAEIAVVNSQVEFTLASGADVNDSYNDQAIVLYDDTNSDFPSIRVITDYVGATKTVTIDAAPDFTLGTDDSIKIFVTAPGSSAPTVGQIRTEMDDNSTQLAAIVEDTNELQTDDYPTSIAAIKAETALIVADTNELQGDDIPGKIDTLDAVVDTVKAETVLILEDTADMQPRVTAIEVDTGTTLQAELDGIQTDTEDKIGRASCRERV